jgi:hypothetical protein
MAACSAWKYKNVSVKVFSSLRSLGQKKGFHIPNTSSGKFTIQTLGMNVDFQYSWNKKSEVLQITCIKKPFVSCSTIKNMADKIVNQSGGQPL